MWSKNNQSSDIKPSASLTETLGRYEGTRTVLSPTTKVMQTNIRLNSGIEMPIVGFGTYRIRGRQLIYTVLEAALQAGYRAFDTAAVYNNESDIGEALKELLTKFNLKRSDIFITSKLSPSDHGAEQVYKAVSNSVRQLGVDWLDLYLIHWPGGHRSSPSSAVHSSLRLDSWRALTELHRLGKLRNIGVSNYTALHMRELVGCEVWPAVNQVEFHPHYRQPPELLDLCHQTGTLLQAYSSLGGTTVAPHSGPLLKDVVVLRAAEKLGVTAPQLLLRWALQQGYGNEAFYRSGLRVSVKIIFGLPTDNHADYSSFIEMDRACW